MGKELPVKKCSKLSSYPTLSAVTRCVCDIVVFASTCPSRSCRIVIGAWSGKLGSLFVGNLADELGTSTGHRSLHVLSSGGGGWLTGQSLSHLGQGASDFTSDWFSSVQCVCHAMQDATQTGP